MRRDAQRNRDQLLNATLELLLERGVEPPLDAVAREAGVGIGTLYRHFPTRTDLFDALGHMLLDRAIRAAEHALESEADGIGTLRLYLRAAVSDGVGALNLLHHLVDDPTWVARRNEVTRAVASVVERAHSDGTVREDVDITDIVHATIRYSRPVGLPIPREEERRIAHRHLDLFIDALRPLID